MAALIRALSCAAAMIGMMNRPCDNTSDVHSCGDAIPVIAVSAPTTVTSASRTANATGGLSRSRGRRRVNAHTAHSATIARYTARMRMHSQNRCWGRSIKRVVARNAASTRRRAS